MRGWPVDRGRRGATLLLFALVGFPLLTFSLMLAFDLSRVYLASRQVLNLAQAAAWAGAAQVKPGETTVDPFRASDKARETVRAGAGPRTKATSLASWVSVTGTTVVNKRDDGVYAFSEVTVTVDYKVNGLFFYDVISRFVGADPGADGAAVYGVTAQAHTCVPGDAGSRATGGSCSRIIEN